MPAGVRFGAFELDCEARELRKSGLRLRLPDQSLDILCMLVARPGEVVTREAIRERLWPNGTIVEFENSVNTAVRRLREAFSDSAAAPRFIETLPRRGYRFLAPVETLEAPATSPHYRILGEAGRGAMGVVYQAEDVSLRRRVALKFLPDELAREPAALERSRREARALAAISHPGVCAIYGVEEHDGQPCLVMEFVEGRPLSRLLEEGPLKLGRALDIAIQLAGALAAAHRAGIVHRDLKPANIMLDHNGRVKVLDFGLAKAMDRTAAPERAMETVTEEGGILGTFAYMSPEQAEGKQVDARSDIFSFGSVLYEMLTGRRAFPGNTRAATLAAILRDNPPPARDIVKDLPPAPERLIARCLRKVPADRFQHMDDVRIALEELQDESTSRHRFLRPVAAALVLIVLIVAAVAVWLVRSKSGPEETPLVAVPLTSYTGLEMDPSLSPDGSQVVFTWWPDNLPRRGKVYVKQIGVEPSSPLTDSAATEYSPAWSPDGRTIAFFRGRPLAAPGFTLILIPQRGGRERVLADVGAIAGTLLYPHIAWTPDSRWLICPLLVPTTGGNSAWALHLISAETGEKRRLTSPPAEAWGDTKPALSPDGRNLVFTRRAPDMSDLYLLRLREGYEPAGEPERLNLKNRYNTGAAWTPDGRDIVFSSGPGTESGLWRMAARKGAIPRQLAFVAGRAFDPSISRQGNRLVYSIRRVNDNIWRVDLRGPGFTPGAPAPLIASTWVDGYPAYSPDGSKIAFASQRSGNWEIWVCDSDASHLEQLTSFGGPMIIGPAWSPDGQSIAFWGTAPNRKQSLFYVISAKGGAPRPLGEGAWPAWSRDGQTIYFNWISGATTSKGIWKIPSGGGAASRTPASDIEADQPQISADGKVLYYSSAWSSAQSVFRVPIDGGEKQKLFDGVSPQCWNVWKEAIYFFTKPDERGRLDLAMYEFATGQTKKILTVDRDVIFNTIAVSPDGRTILYPQRDEAGSDLMLVENFR